MKRLLILASLAAGLVGLSGCGDKPQTMGGLKGDVAAYEGAQNPFVAPGWTPGDKTSWEQGLKARMLRTQNEYSKIY